MRVRLLALAACTLLPALAAGPARAAYPNANGPVAYADASGSLALTDPGRSTTTAIATPGASDVTQPDFTPDGSKIAFVALSTGGDRDVYVVNVDGSGLRRVTSEPGDERGPAWAPDGDRIAYATAQGQLKVLRTSTGRIAAPDTAGRTVNDPAWSREGAQIAFSAGDGHLWLVSAGGSRVAIPLTSGPGVDDQPDYAPDGATIAFRSTRDGNSEIYTVPWDGGPARRLTADPAADSDPTWAPDGSRILFRSDRGGAPQAWVVQPGGEGASLAIAARVSSPDWGAAAGVPYLAPGAGSPKGQSTRMGAAPAASCVADADLVVRRAAPAKRRIKSATASLAGRRVHVTIRRHGKMAVATVPRRLLPRDKEFTVKVKLRFTTGTTSAHTGRYLVCATR